MANPIINTQGSVASSLLKADKAGKGDAKDGVFAKLIASFQKHIKQSEAHAQMDGSDKGFVKGKLGLDGLKEGFIKINSENKEGMGKAKSLLKVAHTDKAAKSVDVHAGSAKSLLNNSHTQTLTDKHGEQQVDLNIEGLAIDSAGKSNVDKEQKDVVVGLGVFQQESRESIQKKAGDSELKEQVFTGLEAKKNKHAANDEKSPGLRINLPDSVEQKGVPVEKNTAGKILDKAVVIEKKTNEMLSAKQDAQGHFSLKNNDVINDGMDVSKLIKRDEMMGVKHQTSDGKSAKSLLSTVNASDDVKAVSQDEGMTRQGLNVHQFQVKQEKNTRLQQGLSAKENDAKIKSPFKAVTANHVNIAGLQTQGSIAIASSIQSDAAIKLSAGQDSQMNGDDRGMGRSAAELLMTDGAARDTRSTRSDFAMQMAYRSAASFKPSDAMLEISKAAKDGTVKLDLMLEPASLGKIQISLQTDAHKQIQVHLIVDQQASRQVLEQQLPQLRQALADQGLSLAGFTMDMNSQQQNDGKASGDMAAKGHVHRHGESENTIALETPLRMGVNMADDGSLSILA